MGEEITKENSLKCTPFCSCIHYTFWPKLWELKLNVDKLDESRKIWGCYSDNNKIPALEVEFSSFKSNEFCPTGARMYPARGWCLTLNTIESFKQCDRTSLLNKYGEVLKKQLVSEECLDDPSHLATFLILIFANLKSYHFHYWFAFLTSGDIEIQTVSPSISLDKVLSKELITELNKGQMELPVQQRGFFTAILKDSHLKVLTLKDFVEYSRLSDIQKDGVYYFVMADPSPLIQYPGWPIRNFMILINQHLPDIARKPIPLIRLRGGSGSSFVNIKLVSCGSLEKWIGWERNDRGKYGPMFVDLSASMDPSKLAEQSVELNLKLMKWRLAPQLDLDVVKNARCLLLGAGTLGCSVARNLLAWGIQNVTFVDNGRVSYSNPVRQSLYTLDDVETSMKNLPNKAVVAASALRKIHPKVNAEGVVMEIPMPGHVTSDKGLCDRLTEGELESGYLANLIEKHDAVFLLTDTRESRWLPTLIAASKRKIVITAALGYDTYLVMRHGVRDSDGTSKRLGCYFCNDITAPGNSMRDRTLDQQCTVTRPGVAGIASSLAVELFISILQHPRRGEAEASEETILGNLPHSIRGFLFNHTQLLPATPSFDNCIACSLKVINEYEKNEQIFLKKVYESTAYLEEVAGISELLMAEELDKVMTIDSDEEDSI